MYSNHADCIFIIYQDYSPTENLSKATAFDKDSWTPHSKKKYPLQTEIYFNFNMHFVLRGLPEN